MIQSFAPFACVAALADVPFRIEGASEGPDWWFKRIRIEPENRTEIKPVPAVVRDLVKRLTSGEPGVRREMLDHCRWPVGTTVFRRLVLTTLTTRVQRGSTVTYSELADLCERPGAARAVGSALAANPFPILIPCHRVVAADGLGWFMGCAEGAEQKRRLLQAEGALERDA